MPKSSVLSAAVFSLGLAACSSGVHSRLHVAQPPRLDGVLVIRCEAVRDLRLPPLSELPPAHTLMLRYRAELTDANQTVWSASLEWPLTANIDADLRRVSNAILRKLHRDKALP